MSELKPCPFCGGEASTTDNTVGCDTCGAMMFSAPGKQDDHWNRRPPCAACAVMMSALEEIADTLEEDGSFHASVKAIREEMARAIAASGDGEVGDG